MPRMQPPKGYIRSKEAQSILNVSSAMIRYYVLEGKIKHLIPNGKTQGFYLESDVRNLAEDMSSIPVEDMSSILNKYDSKIIIERLDAIEKQLDEHKALLSQILEHLPKISDK